MNLRWLFGLRNETTPATPQREGKMPFWTGQPSVSTNILLTAIINLLSNVLGTSRPTPVASDLEQRNQARRILGAPPVGDLFRENPSGDAWIDYRSWLRIIISKLLVEGKVFFEDTGEGYRLGDVAIAGTPLPATVSFTPIPSVLEVRGTPQAVPIQRLGVIQTVGPSGAPAALLGDPAKTALAAYQSLLDVLAAKIGNEPTVAFFLATNPSAISAASSTVGLQSPNQPEKLDVDTVGTYGKVSPLADIKDIKGLEVLDRKIQESLSACLTAVLNVLSIPKEVYNVHVSHTGTVHGEVMFQFLRMACQPLADTIVAGLNQYSQRSGGQQWEWDLPVSDWQGALYLSKVVPAKDLLTRSEGRAMLYRLSPTDEEAIATSSAGQAPDEDPDDRDRTTRDREQEVSNDKPPLRAVK